MLSVGLESGGLVPTRNLTTTQHSKALFVRLEVEMWNARAVETCGATRSEAGRALSPGRSWRLDPWAPFTEELFMQLTDMVAASQALKTVKTNGEQSTASSSSSVQHNRCRERKHK